MIRNRAFRWLLLAAGLVAILALTSMNILSLYDLRDKMVEDEGDRQTDLLEDITRLVREEMYSPFRGLYKLELEPIEKSIAETGHFPDRVREVMEEASQNPMFDGIYYTPEGTDPCDEGIQIYQYSKELHSLTLVNNYPNTLCDGVGLIRTKARIQVHDFDYRWNLIVEFDTHRSMNLGLINLNESKVIGYLTFKLNQDYIINEMIGARIQDFFPPSEESGVVVWLHDWVKDEVLATNDPTIEYNRELVDYRQRFSGYFSNWNIKIAFLSSPAFTMYNASLTKNLIVLGVAGVFLFGALLFMFYTAQRERALSQRQANFLANVTHELKTPLAVMQAAGENISDGRVTEPNRLKSYGAHIYSESVRLREMIEKLLDVAKTDAGQSLIESAPHYLNDIVGRFIDQNTSYFESKGFEVAYTNSAKDSLIMVDQNSVETVLNNLATNAVKYSDKEKFVGFTIGERRDFVYVSVTDKGIGIPKKDLKNIFKKFYRVGDPLSNHIKGHGLGLSIVRSLVKLNGGSIKVRSEEGMGSTFTIFFPKLISKKHAQPAHDEAVISHTTLTQQTEHV
ncbi:MAG: ATP-binding protein [Bacteroidota bacterium]